MGVRLIPLASSGSPCNVQHPVIGRVTSAPVSDRRGDYVRMILTPEAEADLDGYAAVLCREPWPSGARVPDAAVISGIDLSHLEDEDVVKIERRGSVRTVYRRRTIHCLRPIAATATASCVPSRRGRSMTRGASPKCFALLT